VAERSSALHRFFIADDVIDRGVASLVGDRAHQVARVLRLRAGEQVILVDAGGLEHVVELSEVSARLVTGNVQSTRPSIAEPRLAITLYQGLVAREKLEWVIQKGTEVGIARIVPVRCARSNVARGESVDDRRLERWRRIATEAAEQSGRGRVPEIRPVVALADVLADAAATGPTLLAWEGERARSVRDALRLIQTTPCVAPTLALFIGPEGGFAPEEITLAATLGALTVSLGPRILRTETAGPVLAALALYELGDMAPGRMSDVGAEG